MPASPKVKKGPCPRCKTRPRNKKSTYCKECGAEIAREKYAEDPERQREYRRRHYKKHPEKVRAAKRRYRQSAKGKATEKAYRESPKGLAVHQAWEQSPEGKEWRRNYEKDWRRKKREELRRLAASLPTAVVQPFVERMLREFSTPRDSPGYGVGVATMVKEKPSLKGMAQAVGVSAQVIGSIVRGSTKSVKMDTADKLAMYGDFSLDELYERAQEWALLTGDPWPEGYYRKPARLVGF